MRFTLAAAGAAALTLVLASVASAHAIMSPPVAKSKVPQQFTLSVPTEEEGATTTEIELTVPDGFSIDSFEPSPGWKREEAATGSGEERVIQKVTWSGGKVPTDEDAVFRFNGSMSSDKTYTFTVRQTYSNGKVVDWSGPGELGHAGADDRVRLRPRRRLQLDADDRRADRGRDRRRARDRRAGDERPAPDVRRAAVLTAVAVAALALPAAAWAHAALLRTVPEASRTIDTPPPRGAAHLQRADRAALRDRLGHRRGRPAGDERRAGQRARLAADARRRRSSACPRAGTSSSGA